RPDGLLRRSRWRSRRGRFARAVLARTPGRRQAPTGRRTRGQRAHSCRTVRSGMVGAMSMDIVVTALLDLAAELPEFPQPILIGGGGLYLKQRHLEDQEGLVTLIPGERWAPARATEDIDV